MGTSTYDFEGTTGAVPGTLTTGYGTFTWASYPNGTSADAAISTTTKHAGSKSVSLVPSTAQAGFHYCATPTATSYTRGYIYLTQAPSNDLLLSYLFGSGYATRSSVGITTDRRIYAASNIGPAGGSQSAANFVPLNEWVRFESKLTATTAEIRVWKTTGGSGVDATGTADGTYSQTASSLGTLDQIAVGIFAVDGSGNLATASAGNLYIDDVAVSDSTWIGPYLTSVNGAAAASETATGTAAATTTRVLSATPSITASGAAVAGKVLTAAGTPSITASGAADAAVITTHNAEAAGTTTVSSAAATTLTRPIAGTASVTASAVATMANQTSADGVIQAIGAARIVIEGETSPGFLYSTVNKNVLTS